MPPADPLAPPAVPAWKRAGRALFGWSTEDRTHPVEAVVASLAFTGPVALGIAIGRPEIGMAAATAALALSGVELGDSFEQQADLLGGALIAVVLSSGLAVMLAGAGQGPAGFLLAAVCAAAVILAGFSRPVLTSAIRMVIFLPMLLTIALATPHRIALLVLLGIGAAWTVLLNLIGGLLARRLSRRPETEKPIERVLTARQRWIWWRRTLAGRQGWQYGGRLGAALLVGAVLQALFPAHHLHWVLLTVAILTPRDPAEPATRLIQRTLGAMIGVGLGAVLLIWPPPIWGLLIGLALIAGVRPILRTGNYLAYTAVMTPLILMVANLGHPATPGLLADRLIATLIGAVLVAAVTGLYRRLPKAPIESKAA